MQGKAKKEREEKRRKDFPKKQQPVFLRISIFKYFSSYGFGAVLLSVLITSRTG
jgi:hypothetical protein